MNKIPLALLLFLLVSPLGFGSEYYFVDQIAELPQHNYLARTETWNIFLDEYFAGFHLSYSLASNSPHILKNPVEQLASETVSGLPTHSNISKLIFALEKGLPTHQFVALDSANSFFAGNLRNNSGLFAPSFSKTVNLTAFFGDESFCQNIFQVEKLIAIECSSESGSSSPIYIAWFSLWKMEMEPFISKLDLYSEQNGPVKDHQISVLDGKNDKRFLAFFDQKDKSQIQIISMNESPSSISLERYRLINAGTVQKKTSFVVNSPNTIESLLVFFDFDAGLVIYDIASGSFSQNSEFYGSQLLTEPGRSGDIDKLWIVSSEETEYFVIEAEIIVGSESLLPSIVHEYSLYNQMLEPKAKNITVNSIKSSSEFIVVDFVICETISCHSETRVIKNGVKEIAYQFAGLPYTKEQKEVCSFNPYNNTLAVIDLAQGVSWELALNEPRIQVTNLSMDETILVSVESNEVAQITSQMSFEWIMPEDKSLSGNITKASVFATFPEDGALYLSGSGIKGFVESVASSNLNVSLVNADLKKTKLESLTDSLFESPDDILFAKLLSYAETALFFTVTQARRSANSIDTCFHSCRVLSEGYDCQLLKTLNGTALLADAFIIGDSLVYFLEDKLMDSYVYLIGNDTLIDLGVVSIPFSCAPQFIMVLNSEELLLCLDSISSQNQIGFLDEQFFRGEKDQFKKVKLPMGNAFQTLFGFPKYPHDFMIQDEKGRLFLFSTDFLDPLYESPMVFIEIKDFNQILANNSRILTDSHHVYIENEDAIEQFEFVRPSTFIFQKTLPLYGCSYFQASTIETRIIGGFLYKMVSCGNTVELVVYEPALPLKSSFHSRIMLPTSNFAAPQDLWMLPGTIEGTSVVLMFYMGKLPLEFGFYVETIGVSVEWEPFIKFETSNLEIKRSSIWAPAIDQVTGKSLSLSSLDGFNTFELDLDLDVMSFMNIIAINPENNLTEWKSQLIGTPDSEYEMMLKVNYSSFIKSHVEKTEGSCGEVSLEVNKGAEFHKKDCGGSNDVYVPNSIDDSLSGLTELPVDIEFLTDMVVFELPNDYIARVSINSSSVQIDLMNVTCGSCFNSTSFVSLDFSSVSEKPKSVLCQKIIKDKSDPVVYLFCFEPFDAAYYGVSIDLSSIQNALEPVYFTNFFIAPATSEIQSIGNGMVGLILRKTENQNGKEEVSSSLNVIRMDRETQEMSAYSIIEPADFQKERVNILSYSSLSVYSGLAHVDRAFLEENEKPKNRLLESLDRIQLFILIQESPRSLYILELENDGENFIIPQLRNTISLVLNEYEADYSCIDVLALDQDQLHLSTNLSTATLAVLASSGDAFLIEINQNTFKLVNEENIQFLNYPPITPSALMARDQMMLLTSPSALLIYPITSYCNEFDLSPEDLASCQEYKTKQNVIGAVNFQKGVLSRIVNQFIGSSSRWECENVLYLSTMTGSYPSTHTVCLSSFISVFYSNKTYEAWQFEFTNAYSSGDSYLIFHTQKVVQWITGILIWIFMVGSISAVLLILHFFYRMWKIHKLKKDEMNSMDVYTKFTAGVEWKSS